MDLRDLSVDIISLVASLRILELERPRINNRRIVSNIANSSKIRVLLLEIATRRFLVLTRYIKLVIRL